MSAKRILLIDNEEGLCRMMEAILTDSGYAPKSYTRSFEAVEAYRPGEWDLVITDLLIGHPIDKPLGEGEQNKALEEIRTRSQQLSSMVEDLAEVSRIKLGKSPSLHYSNTDLHQASTSTPQSSKACPSDNPNGRDPDGEGLEEAFRQCVQAFP